MHDPLRRDVLRASGHAQPCGCGHVRLLLPPQEHTCHRLTNTQRCPQGTRKHTSICLNVFIPRKGLAACLLLPSPSPATCPNTNLFVGPLDRALPSHRPVGGLDCPKGFSPSFDCSPGMVVASVSIACRRVKAPLGRAFVQGLDTRVIVTRVVVRRVAAGRVFFCLLVSLFSAFRCCSLG